jgi:hypothetical protein
MNTSHESQTTIISYQTETLHKARISEKHLLHTDAKISYLGRLEELKLKANLSYIGRSFLKTQSSKPANKSKKTMKKSSTWMRL